MTERLRFHFSLSCIGEGNGNPLQCSCLENPRDRGAWWAAVYRVTQSQTRLKRLNSRSSSRWFSGKESACNVGDPGSIPGRPRLDPWVGKNPLEKVVATHSGILAGNPMDRGAW